MTMVDCIVTRNDVLSVVQLNNGMVTFSSWDCSAEHTGSDYLTAYMNAQTGFVQVPAMDDAAVEGLTMTSRVMHGKHAGVRTPGGAFVVYCSEEELVLTVAMARRAPEAQTLWRTLIQTAETSISAMDYPRLPWLAFRFEQATAPDSRLASALMAFNTKLAWLWIDYMYCIDRELI
jgi:hypothetical protein